MDSDWEMKCVVCGTKKEYGQKLQFFKFPREITRCRSWLKAIGKKELITIPMEDLCELLVCATHFHSAGSNERGSRLYKAGVPSLTPYPFLSDSVLAGYPKHRASSQSAPLSHVFSLSEQSCNPTMKNENVASLTNTVSTIDYNLPLMNSLEPLIQNNYKTVQKPRGMPNSIAVPLMSYSSSTAQGTVFGVEDPGEFKLPFVPFIAPAGHAQKTTKLLKNKFSKTQTNKDHHYTSSEVVSQTPTLVNAVESSKMPKAKAKDMTFLVHPNALDVSPVVNKDKSETKNTLTPRSPYVSYGLQTKIFAHGRRPSKDNPKPDVVPSTKINNRITGSINHPKKPLKQYVNKRRINSMLQNTGDLLASNIGTTNQNTATGLNANLTGVRENDLKTDEETSEDNTSSTDLVFVPYTQYEGTVSPESPTAHIGEGALNEYGLPLMNCIGTIFQNNEQYTKMPEETDSQMVIDVPLMQCLKTLKYSNINQRN